MRRRWCGRAASAEVLQVVAIVAVFAVLLGAVFLSEVANWQTRARRAANPVAERRVTPPAPEREVTVASVGYREMSATIPPPARRARLQFDQARDRGKDERVLPEGNAMALRFHLSLSTTVLVRVDASRDGDDVVFQAFATVVETRNTLPDWRERLDLALAPVLDRLVEELTGVRPTDIPKTRVVVEEEDPDERAARRAIDRRGWPKE
jgi:hypothetical protein